MSEDFKKEEKIQHHKQENPSLVSATFIKYFFMTVITLVILYFLAFYLLPMFDRDGEQKQENGDNGVLEIEITNPVDGSESNGEAK